MTRRKGPKHPRHQPDQRRQPEPNAPPRAAWPPLVIAISGVLVYLNSFKGAFLFDDLKRIVANRHIRSVGAAWDTLSTSRRPAVNLSLAVNYHLDRLEVWGYHLVNIAVHVLAALILYGIVRRTLLRLSPASPSRRAVPWLALAVALIWVVHPLQTQSVNYLVQRSESMMGLFYLLTLYCVIRGADSGRSKPWHAAAVLACALGMGSKAVMISAPLIVLLYDRLFISKSISRILRRRWGLYGSLAVTWLVLVFCGVARGVLDPSLETSTVGFGYKGVTPFEYARTQPQIILHYLRLCFWPGQLCLDYGWPVAESWARILAASLVVGGLGLGTVWALLRRPWLGFAGAWFFLILAPTSSFVPIRDLAFEHRMYLPLAAVVVVVVVTVQWLVTSGCARFGAKPGVHREVKACLLAVVAVALGLRTLVRNLDYRTPVAMWTSVVQVRPEHARAHQNLGFELSNLGQSERAIEQFRQAVDLDPGFAEAQHSLGRELTVAGKPAEGIPYLQEAVRLDPNHDRAHTNLGITLAQLGRLDEAVSHYRRALEIKPRSADTHYALGAALLRQDKVAEAVEAFEETLRINPRHRNARQALQSIRRAQPQSAAPPPERK